MTIYILLYEPEDDTARIIAGFYSWDEASLEKERSLKNITDSERGWFSIVEVVI